MFLAFSSIFNSYSNLFMYFYFISNFFILQFTIRKLIILFQILSKQQMLTKILELHHSNLNFLYHSKPTLHLPKDTYEDYLAYLFQSNEQFTIDDHSIYLEKMAFDCVLDSFSDEQLLQLQQKEDMYMCYIMHSTLKNSCLVTQQQFAQNLMDLYQFYMATQDEKMFIDKIQGIVKSALVHQISPFTYLQVCKDLFSQKLRPKLIYVLKYIIGDSFSYKMASASIFGICLQWAVNRYGIKNSSIIELIAHLIDVNNPETCEKIGEIACIMDQVMNIKSSS